MKMEKQPKNEVENENKDGEKVFEIPMRGVNKAIDFCEKHGLHLVAKLRSYGYALYAESGEEFPGWERKTRDSVLEGEKIY